EETLAATVARSDRGDGGDQPLVVGFVQGDPDAAAGGGALGGFLAGGDLVEEQQYLGVGAIGGDHAAGLGGGLDGQVLFLRRRYDRLLDELEEIGTEIGGQAFGSLGQFLFHRLVLIAEDIRYRAARGGDGVGARLFRLAVVPVPVAADTGHDRGGDDHHGGDA